LGDARALGEGLPGAAGGDGPDQTDEERSAPSHERLLLSGVDAGMVLRVSVVHQRLEAVDSA
jgi:hypothetical protein